MKKISLAATMAALVMATPVLAHEIPGKQPHSHPQNRAHAHTGPTVQHQIRINCYRGPLSETIWDHARAVFIDDLVTFGYDYTNALAIATRVCRDVTSVGNPERLRQGLLNAIAETPPGH